MQVQMQLQGLAFRKDNASHTTGHDHTFNRAWNACISETSAGISRNRSRISSSSYLNHALAPASLCTGDNSFPFVVSSSARIARLRRLNSITTTASSTKLTTKVGTVNHLAAAYAITQSQPQTISATHQKAGAEQPTAILHVRPYPSNLINLHTSCV